MCKVNTGIVKSDNQHLQECTLWYPKNVHSCIAKVYILIQQEAGSNILPIN